MSELRERILAAKDLASERVHVEAWDVDVEVRGMSARARAVLVSKAMDGGAVNLVAAYPLMVIECTFHPETGERLFSEADIEALAGKSGEALEQIATVAARLSGLDAEAAVRSKSGAKK